MDISYDGNQIKVIEDEMVTYYFAPVQNLCLLFNYQYDISVETISTDPITMEALELVNGEAFYPWSTRELTRAIVHLPIQYQEEYLTPLKILKNLFKCKK